MTAYKEKAYQSVYKYCSDCEFCLYCRRYNFCIRGGAIFVYGWVQYLYTLFPPENAIKALCRNGFLVLRFSL